MDEYVTLTLWINMPLRVLAHLWIRVQVKICYSLPCWLGKQDSCYVDQNSGEYPTRCLAGWEKTEHPTGSCSQRQRLQNFSFHRNAVFSNKKLD